MVKKISGKHLDKIIDDARKETRQDLFKELENIWAENPIVSTDDFAQTVVPKMVGSAYVSAGHLAESIVCSVLDHLDLVDHDD